MSIGWIVVSVCTFTVAGSMAEIVSACPTSGGPYHCTLATLEPFTRFFEGTGLLLGHLADLSHEQGLPFSRNPSIPLSQPG